MIGHLHGVFRTVELDVDIGSSALDYAALQKSEVTPLSPYPPQMSTMLTSVEIETD